MLGGAQEYVMVAMIVVLVVGVVLINNFVRRKK
jgi:hypothetical protein